MRFRVLITSGVEVVFAGQRPAGPVYHGATPESGVWHISMSKFEDYVAAKLQPLVFGESIEEFQFGFEIGEITKWGKWFKATSNYVSYRPKSKLLVSVGQLEWKVVRNVPANEQLMHLSKTLMTSIKRLDNLKRKPKHFDRLAFADAIQSVLSKCNTYRVVANGITT